MTVKEASRKFKVKEKTVQEWCEKGYIRGTTVNQNNEYVIPKGAKAPYTECRAKNADAIYSSIVKGILKNKDVFASLYGISDDHFNKYIEQLIHAGVINTYIEKETNIEYFCTTLESSEFSKLPKNKVKEYLKNININFNIVLC